MKNSAILLRIENDHKISRDTDHEFLLSICLGLLLTLKEQGRLNEVQLCRAEKKLREQQIVPAKKSPGKGRGRF